MKPSADATIDWRVLEAGDDELYSSQCLYVMAHPVTRKILYLGKADYSTVARRLLCGSKLGVWEALDSYDLEGCAVLVGQVQMPRGKRLSSKLLANIESLLIMIEQPPGNSHCKRSRLPRPGLLVRCVGDWKGRGEYYLDNHC